MRSAEFFRCDSRVNATPNLALPLGGKQTPPATHIAMWSGPRNISTAMMRAWGNREDTFVCDEPLYAFYLASTGLPHPAAAEIIRRHEPDWCKVVDWLTGKVPQNKAVFYQKQMVHHLLPEVPRDWLAGLTNCFLIRDPAEVIASYVRKNGDPAAEDIGFPQQASLFDWVRSHTDQTPPVLDSRDVLENPRRMLGLLCETLHLPFFEAMLSWPAGLRDTDGIWAEHWYAEVARSTTFAPYRPRREPVPPHLRGLHDVCQEHYQRLYEHRLR